VQIEHVALEVVGFARRCGLLLELAERELGADPAGFDAPPGLVPAGSVTAPGAGAGAGNPGGGTAAADWPLLTLALERLRSGGASNTSRSHASRSSSGVISFCAASGPSAVGQRGDVDGPRSAATSVGYFRPRMSKFRSHSALTTACFSFGDLGGSPCERVEVDVDGDLRGAERPVPLLALRGERLQDVARDHQVVVLDERDEPLHAARRCRCS
jgi:hypothetical protein